MHELSITRGVIEIVSSEAQKQHFQRVLEIKLRVGEYSGLIPECIREFFPIAAKGSIAENAELVIEPIRAEFECMDCGYKGAVDRKDAACPLCGSEAIHMTSGREFFVESLKVE